MEKDNPYKDIEENYPEISEIVTKTVAEIQALKAAMLQLSNRDKPYPHPRGPGYIPIDTKLRDAENIVIYERLIHEQHQNMLDKSQQALYKKQASPEQMQRAKNYIIHKLAEYSENKKTKDQIEKEKEQGRTEKKSLAEKYMESTPLASYILDIEGRIKTDKQPAEKTKFEKFKDNSRDIEH